MSGTHVIAGQRREQILLDSICQRRNLLLTHHGAEGWRMLKARFVPGSPSTRAILAEVSIPREEDGLALPQPGEKLGCTFRLGHKKCMFCAVVESTRLHNDSRPSASGKRAISSAAVPALITLRWPDDIQQLQRRAFERACPPTGSVIAVRFWHEEARLGASLNTRAVRHGQLEDISAGGMRIKAANPKELELGRTYRCAFSPRPGRPSFVLDAILRHLSAVEQGRASLGFKFVGLEVRSDGRQVLDRLTRLVDRFKQARRVGHR